MKIQTIIAEDHKIVSDLYRTALGENIEVVETVANGLDLLSAVSKHMPDLIITDVVMQGMDGITASKEIKKKYPKTKIVIVTAFEKKHLVHDAREAGVNAFLLKRTLTSSLLTKILDLVVVSDHYIEGEGVPELTKYSIVQNDLSRREEDILHQMGKGKTIKEVSESLYIAVDTVKKHIDNMKAKLKIKNRERLIKFAVEQLSEA